MQVTTSSIVSGGQTIATLEDGCKAFLWNSLPGEVVNFTQTKKKSKYVEGIVDQVISPSPDRIDPQEPDSYLSTSPWQIMSFEAEQKYKSQLISEALRQQHIDYPAEFIKVFSDNQQFEYRNKMEFSWYSELDESTGRDSLDLAFYRRGSKGKIPINDSRLAKPEISKLAKQIRNLLRTKDISARNLKTLIVRADSHGNCVWQLYLKDPIENLVSQSEAERLSAQGGEIIFSNPKSPASVITKRLNSFGNITLTDQVLNTPFRYAAESFFQINLPVYEQALKDMSAWIVDGSEVLDLYSGVGSIGLTIGGDSPTLVEINEYAVEEMKRNIVSLASGATAVLAPSEQALSYIKTDQLVIVDPPRAGLHKDVTQTLLDKTPQRIVYLSCNPVTQARDVELLLEKYEIKHIAGYNFFPRTPHIESLIVLDKKLD